MITPTHGSLTMTKEQMKAGLQSGRSLMQEEWAHPDEIKSVNELIAEGVAVASLFEYRDNFQCACRTIKGVSDAKS